jgi:hypothetical protein
MRRTHVQDHSSGIEALFGAAVLEKVGRLSTLFGLIHCGWPV